MDSASGDLRVGYIGGDATVSSASGDVVVGQAGGSVRVKSASGDVRLESVRRGEARLSTASGDVEVGVPAGEPLGVFDLSDTHVGVDEYDAATQRSASHHFTLRDGVWERRSSPFRSVWPSELDLMARLAGMQLSERWADWDRSPFTAGSTKHVSVWMKP